MYYHTILFELFVSRSLANQLIQDCQRGGLSQYGFLQGTDLQQGYNEYHIHNLFSYFPIITLLKYYWNIHPCRIASYLHCVEDVALRGWLQHGIAIHTAGLCKN